MENKEVLMLPDKNVVPDDNLIFSLIGDRKNQWQEIINYAGTNYKGSSGEWRYYNDGKQWLYKFQHKKKTIFWIAILDGTFRITFYFGNKAEPAILSSDLPEPVRKDFITAKRYGNIRAISFKVDEFTDSGTITRLIDLKSSLK
jgi:hypothetical protein